MAYEAVFVRDKAEATVVLAAGRPLARSSSDDCIMYLSFREMNTRLKERKLKRRGEESKHGGMQACGEAPVI